MGPLTLCGTLFPGLNNECAGLPLVLKATIISLGLTITHAVGFGDRVGRRGGSMGMNLCLLVYVYADIYVCHCTRAHGCLF